MKIPKTPYRAKAKDDWHGLPVTGKIIIGDWEGDPDVPNGVRTYPPYVEDLAVTTPDGTDIYEMLKESAIDEINEMLVLNSMGENEREAEDE
jgi:hypothetical protein